MVYEPLRKPILGQKTELEDPPVRGSIPMQKLKDGPSRAHDFID